MAKILVNLMVPAIDSSYDLFIPDDMRIRLLTNLLAGEVAEISEGAFFPSGGECLCDREQNRTLEASSTVRDAGIRSGDHLLLF